MYPRKTATSIAAVALVVLLAGCSGATGGGEPAEDVASKITIGLSGGVNTLDPHNTRTVASDLSVIGSIYSALVLRAPDGTINPSVAAEWSDEDSTVWTFELNPDAVFSDSSPVDADAVVWNFDRAMNSEPAMKWGSLLTNVESVEAVDDLTVRITLSGPNPEFLSTLSSFFLLDPEWTAEHDPTREAMGSGPYVLSSFTPTGPLELVANEEFWGTAPSIEVVHYVDLGGSDAEINGLLADEVDLVGGISPRESERLAESPGVEVESVSTNRTAFIKFNTTKSPVDNVLVRQALNYAVDKQAIIDSLLLGTVEPTRGQILTDTYPGYDPDLEPYAFDPERALELLAEAGYPDGFDLQLDVPIESYVEAENISQAVAAQLAEVGVNVTIATMPLSNLLDKYVGPNADMAQSMYITQAADTTGDLASNFQAASPYAYFPDQTYSDLVEAAKTNSDSTDISANWAEANEYLREQAPVLFLFPQPATYGVSTNIDWRPRPDGYILPFEMSVGAG